MVKYFVVEIWRELLRVWGNDTRVDLYFYLVLYSELGTRVK